MGPSTWSISWGRWPVTCLDLTVTQKQAGRVRADGVATHQHVDPADLWRLHRLAEKPHEAGPLTMPVYPIPPRPQTRTEKAQILLN